ncbi:MAG: hypothetical protein AAF765_03835 [Bacteroidota bacterium]|nr:hypothetical protein [uncultured Allomuricauda sp.]
MKRLLACVAVLSVGVGRCQKVLKKTFVDSHISTILIDTKNCYEVILQTSPSHELQVDATMEGEYSKDLLVELEKDGKSVWVSTGFQPNFVFPNDKLSAHKVISIALRVRVPEYKKVQVFGTNSQVSVEGKYSDLNITLSDGDCRLYGVGEDVEVVTQKGDVWVNTTSGVFKAMSDYGKVHKTHLPLGNNHYNIQSKEGNIYLNKTK